jgi:hypothetical protein
VRRQKRLLQMQDCCPPPTNLSKEGCGGAEQDEAPNRGSPPDGARHLSCYAEGLPRDSAIGLQGLIGVVGACMESAQGYGQCAD